LLLMKLDIIETSELPNGVTATEGITIKGPKGEVTKKLRDPQITITVETNKITIS